jgi:Viral BACON domain/Putative binding domain, N-terminal
MVRPVAFWSATCAAAVLLGCGGSTEQVVTPSSGTRCQMSLGAVSFSAAGGRMTAPLSAARECLWSARTSATWLQVEPASGQGEATLTFVAAENPQGRTRSATVDINDQPFTVAQAPAPCRYEVTPPTASVGHQGGRLTLQLSTLEGCTWTTASSQPWLRVASGSGGDTSAAIQLAVDSNTGAERSALLRVATLVVSVSQAPGPNDRTECRFSLHPGSFTVPAAGGTGSFGVSTLPGCAWSAASTQPWVVIVTSANVIGSGPVSYRVDPNPSPSVRSAAITAGTRQHVVRQEAGPRP